MRPDPLVTTTEAAALLDISQATFYRWAKAGKLPPPVKQRGRINYRRADIVAAQARTGGHTKPIPDSLMPMLFDWIDSANTTRARAQMALDGLEAALSDPTIAAAWRNASDQRQQLAEKLETLTAGAAVSAAYMAEELPRLLGERDKLES